MGLVHIHHKTQGICLEFGFLSKSTANNGYPENFTLTLIFIEEQTIHFAPYQ